MPFPASRITDLHVCPMLTGPVPHVGGPVATPGAASVLIGCLPAACVGSMAICVGPPDAIASGSATVLVGRMPLARITSSCTHGGTVILGCPTVLVP